MNVLGLIGQIFKPAMEMIDNVHTSTEEKLQQKAQLLELQTAFLVEALLGGSCQPDRGSSRLSAMTGAAL